MPERLRFNSLTEHVLSPNEMDAERPLEIESGTRNPIRFSVSFSIVAVLEYQTTTIRKEIYVSNFKFNFIGHGLPLLANQQKK